MLGGSQLVTEDGGIVPFTWLDMLKPDTIIRSIDLHKVVMLPGLPGFKAA